MRSADYIVTRNTKDFASSRVPVIFPDKFSEKNSVNNSKKSGIKLGLFNGMKYIAEGHGIDECNDEIAEMFGVND